MKLSTSNIHTKKIKNLFLALVSWFSYEKAFFLQIIFWNCRNESTLHCPIFSRAHLLVVETRPAVLQCFFKDSRSSILRHEVWDISSGFIESIGNSLSLINKPMKLMFIGGYSKTQAGKAPRGWAGQKYLG